MERAKVMWIGIGIVWGLILVWCVWEAWKSPAMPSDWEWDEWFPDQDV